LNHLFQNSATSPPLEHATSTERRASGGPMVAIATQAHLFAMLSHIG
jgi:hypothetical protein